eukprot:123147_1
MVKQYNISTTLYFTTELIMKLWLCESLYKCIITIITIYSFSNLLQQNNYNNIIIKHALLSLNSSVLGTKYGSNIIRGVYEQSPNTRFNKVAAFQLKITAFQLKITD